MDGVASIDRRKSVGSGIASHGRRKGLPPTPVASEGTSTEALVSVPGFGSVPAASPVATLVSTTLALVPGGTDYAYATDAGPGLNQWEPRA
ncbi:hypothetical protein SUGI_1481680 [Cryptomeria japonica]|uniref:Uncharacterized protein n=1 Tax=Cryptomeria japonica TaxID=3369 RepID=A0AAD3NTG6_CRYJA|nr:hypothetical protein SUGI_1481680 [Cryptomeria japonica]